jgi:hypothetical protein
MSKLLVWFTYSWWVIEKLEALAKELERILRHLRATNHSEALYLTNAIADFRALLAAHAKEGEPLIDEDAEAAADKAGAYGAGPETGDHPDDCKCRICFIAEYHLIRPALAAPDALREATLRLMTCWLDLQQPTSDYDRVMKRHAMEAAYQHARLIVGSALAPRKEGE